MTTCIIVILQLVGFTASSYTGSNILGICKYCIGNEKTACVCGFYLPSGKAPKAGITSLTFVGL